MFNSKMFVITRPGNQETMGLKPAVDHSAYGQRGWLEYMGLSENSVPLNPMVNDPYPY